MTKIDLNVASNYVRTLLDLEENQGLLRIGRMHNRTVNDLWGESDAIRLRSHHLTMVNHGQAHFQINDQRILLQPGSLLFASPKCWQTYGFVPGEPPGVLTVRFDPEGNEANVRIPTPPPEGCFLVLNPGKETFFSELMEHLFRCWIRRADPIAYRASHCTLQSLLWSLLEKSTHEEKDSRDQLMEDIRLMLESDPESNLTISDLANQVGLSAAHFSRRFHKYAGITAKSYQFQVRMRHARDILQKEGLSVKEVADRLGYSDAFIFSRQFKKNWGISPSKV